MKQTLNRILSFLENIAIVISASALILIMVSITADAFGRYFLNKPFQGQYEFTSLYLMVILTFLGLAKIQAQGGHISVPVMRTMVARLPGKPAERITALAAALAFAFITIKTGEEALHKIAARSTTFGAIQFPTYLSYCWVPVGTGLLTLRLAYQTFWPRSDLEDEAELETSGL
ncbi:MAG: TRAP transporter small permease [Qingshengfaniella sp.]